MTETEIHRGVAGYLKHAEAITRQFTFTHPNATNSNPRYAAKLKSMGQKAGVPDLVIFLEGGRTIFFELKKKGGRLTGIQRDFHGVLRTLGFSVETIEATCVPHALDQIIPILRMYGIRVPH